MQRGPERVLDEYLVLSAQGGSRQAVVELVQRWTPRLTRHAARLLGGGDSAQDVVQDTWISIVQGLRGLEDPSRFPGWVYAIATRKCTDALRGRYRRRRLAEDAAREAAPAPPAQNPNLDDRLDLGAALHRLSPEQSIVVDMFYGADLSVEEIAGALNTPVGTVKSRLFNARQTLKQEMEGVSS